MTDSPTARAHSVILDKEKAIELVQKGSTTGYVEEELIPQKSHIASEGKSMVMIIRELATDNLYSMFYNVLHPYKEIDLDGNEYNDDEQTQIFINRIVLNEITVKRYISVTSKPSRDRSVFRP